MNLKQKELKEWRQRNFCKGETGNCDNCPFIQLAGMIEELGELAHPLLKAKQGIRGMTMDKAKPKIADAFADCVIYGQQLLSQLDIDAEEALNDTINHVLTRDWVSDPVNAITATQHKQEDAINDQNS